MFFNTKNIFRNILLFVLCLNTIYLNASVIMSKINKKNVIEKMLNFDAKVNLVEASKKLDELSCEVEEEQPLSIANQNDILVKVIQATGTGTETYIENGEKKTRRRSISDNYLASKKSNIPLLKGVETNYLEKLRVLQEEKASFNSKKWIFFMASVMGTGAIFFSFYKYGRIDKKACQFFGLQSRAWLLAFWYLVLQMLGGTYAFTYINFSESKRTQKMINRVIKRKRTIDTIIQIKQI